MIFYILNRIYNGLTEILDPSRTFQLGYIYKVKLLLKWLKSRLHFCYKVVLLEMFFEKTSSSRTNPEILSH